MLKRTLNDEHIQFQAIRHLVIGASGVMVNWISFCVLRQFVGFSTLFSTIITHIILFSYIFPLQKYVTFKEKKAKPHNQAIKFVINSLGYILIDFLLTALLIDLFGLIAYIGKAISLALLTPLSFLSQKLWVFKETKINQAETNLLDFDPEIEN